MDFASGSATCDNDAHAMRLLTVHKILIAMGAGLALLLAARGAFLYSSSHVNEGAATGVAGIVIAGILLTYLRSIWRR